MARDTAAMIKDLEDVQRRMTEHNENYPRLLDDPRWDQWSAEGEALQKEADEIWIRGMTPEEAAAWRAGLDADNKTISFLLPSGEILDPDGRPTEQKIGGRSKRRLPLPPSAARDALCELAKLLARQAAQEHVEPAREHPEPKPGGEDQ